MARLVRFNDGSTHTFLGDTPAKKDIEEILKEYVGDDAVEMFQDFCTESFEQEDEVESFRRDCEMSVEHYLFVLRDVCDSVYELLQCCESNTKRKTRETLQMIHNKISTEL
jgi:hypothetical protein